MNKLKDVLPYEFFDEYMDTPAAKLLEQKVIKEYDGCIKKWIGNHKYVFVWWTLENGKAVGWNENPAIGWSFPVINIKKKMSAHVK